MAKHIVIKSFHTPTRRFSVDQEITETDIDGALSLADWVRLGYVDVLQEVTHVDTVDAIAPAAPDPVTDTAQPADAPAPATEHTVEAVSAD